MSDWTEIMPTIDKMDVVTGTPVRFLKGDEASGFPLRHDMSLTVRPWGEEEDKYCMVIDDRGTSVPCPMDSLVIDLAHPLGFAAALQWLYHQHDVTGWENAFGWQSVVIRCMSGTWDGRDTKELSGLISKLVGGEE